jgi:hypothetical protein
MHCRVIYYGFLLEPATTIGFPFPNICVCKPVGHELLSTNWILSARFANVNFGAISALVRNCERQISSNYTN